MQVFKIKKISKKILLLIICLAFVLLPKTVLAEDYSDREYWDNHCKGNDSKECDAYRAFLLEENRNTIKDLEDALANLGEEFDKAVEVANNAKGEISALANQIDKLNVEITELQTKVKALESDIAKNQVLVDELNARVIDRMRKAQETMHFNPYLDFLLGSSSFDDLMRRSYGVDAITSKDEEDRDKLIETIKKLDADKAELDKNLHELADKEKVLKENQAYYYQIEEKYSKIAEEIESEIIDKQNELDAVRKNYDSILGQIGDISNIPSSAGLLSPAPGASINEGTWYYSGGGVHLGVDYGLGMGASLYAPANGVVILSADGCPSTGYLGNGCGANIGGVYAGGNQVIMIVSAQDRVYGVSFFHLQQGSPTGTGTIAEGDYVGRVGSSGNSTGPHCHIELYYLGEGDMSDIQNDYLLRNYTLGFNCGWGYAGLNRLCENGVGAPCRLRPELYFGN